MGSLSKNATLTDRRRAFTTHGERKGEENRNVNCRAFATVALTVFVFGSLLCAQGIPIPVDQIHSGSKLVALVTVPVRDRAPTNGTVYVKGNQIGTLRVGNEIIVTGEQIVPTLLGAQKWVSFTRSDKLLPSSGWVLVGDRGKASNIFDQTR